MKSTIHKIRLLLGLGIIIPALWLQGCVSTFSKAPAALPRDIPGTFGTSSGPDALPITAGLLDIIDSNRLRGLVDEALENNPDIKAAAFRLGSARYLLSGPASGRLPKLSAGFSSGKSNQEYNYTTFERETQTTHKITANVSWEIDLWGRLADQYQAAGQEVQAKEQDFQKARDLLAARVVQAWIRQVSARRAKSIETQRISVLQQIEDILIHRYQDGIGSLDEYAAARTRTQVAKADLSAREADLSNSIRSLEVLLGRYPQGQLSRGRDWPALALPALDTPAAVLLNRPDIRAGLARVDAARNQARAADKARLPGVTLSGELFRSGTRLSDIGSATTYCIFHEIIPIPGTDLSLHYSTANLSNEMEINIPLSGEVVPDNLLEIELVITIAGKGYSYSFDPVPNLNYLFQWDGLDRRGNLVTVPTTLKATISFVYQGYYTTGTFADNYLTYMFGKYPDAWPDWVKARAMVKKAQSYELKIPAPPKINRWFYGNGWTLSKYHYLSPIDPTVLLKGDGGKATLLDTDYKYSRIEQCNILEKIGGAVFQDFFGDNGPAVEAGFSWPQGIAMDDAGNFYISDAMNSRLRKIDTGGIVTTIAGNGDFQDGTVPVDGLPATDVPLRWPTDIIVDNRGNLFFIDAEPECGGPVLKIDKSGIISTVVGGDAMVYGIALDSEGNLFIAEPGEARIRMVDPTGEITLVAGSGEFGNSGDGGNAMAAKFSWPVGLVVDRAGNLYIVDNGAHVVRKVDVSGIITTVAGTGECGNSGDGGKATMARLFFPVKAALDAQGNLYVLNFDGIRKVNTDGVIKTITGDGGTSQAIEGELIIQPDTGNKFSNLTIDDLGNIYTTMTYPLSMIAKIGPLVPYLDTIKSEEHSVYAEPDGCGHVIDSAGRHLKTIDLETGATLYSFNYLDENSYGLVGISDAFSNTTTISNGIITSPEGLQTKISNNRLLLNRITFPDGTYYEFEYDEDGYMTAEIDPEGNKFLHTFSDNGKITDVEDENGGHWTYEREYKKDGSVITLVTTGEGYQRQYEDFLDASGDYTSQITNKAGGQSFYHLSGLTGEKINACGLQTNFEYGIDPRFKYKYLTQVTETTPSGLTRSTDVQRTYTDPEASGTDIAEVSRTVNGLTTLFINNAGENRRSVISPEGRTVDITYNPDTLVTENVTIPGLWVSTFVYDAKGRLTTSTTGDRTFRYTYGSNGFVNTITDPSGNTRTFTHDENGRTTRIHRPDNTDIYFTWDGNDNVTVLTTPSAVNHSFDYNKVDLNAGYTPPLSSSYTFEFDRDRRPTRTIFPSGKTIENTYESDLDRLATIQTPEGTICFTYLCGAKVGSVTKGSESLTYDYDAGLITSQTQAGTLYHTLSWSYNDDFRVSGMTYAGTTIDYGYDNDGLLTRAGDFTIIRNSGNGLPESVSGGNLEVDRDFNGYGEISTQATAVNGSSLFSYSLDRDNTGRIARKTETLAGATTVFDYAYDTMGRLLTVTKDGILVEEYQYNANGARILETNTLRNITGRTFEYTGEDHLLKAGTATYTHDADGFLTSRTKGQDVTNYTYSIRGELLNVTLSNADVIEYVHDPLGRRIAKKINGTTTEKYLWQGLTRLLAVYDGSNSLIMRFEYADGRLPVAITKGGTTYYPAFDQAGTLRAVADASGNVVKQLEYDTFGNVINDTAPGFAVPFGFAGGLYDPDTGFVRFGYRDYDPDTGRWAAKDPIFFNGGDTDLYGYVQDDPVNWVDPLGLFVFGVFGGGSGGIGGVIDGSAAVVVDHTGDVALAVDVAGSAGPMATADLSAGVVIAPFAKTSDLAGESKRVNLGFGLFGVSIAIPDNPWNTAVSIDILPGFDFGITYGAGNTWLFGEDQESPCK